MPTILDLFLNNPDLTGAPTNQETKLDHLKHGIRIKSAVDLNNPLLFGTDVLRIATRSTRTLEIMKEGRQITNGEANNGLIGKGISKITGGKINSLNGIRNSIGDFLGLPQPLIPTVVAGKLGKGINVQDILDAKNGTELGKFLKQTGGGNPKTLLKQTAGSAITGAKELLRKKLFGAPAELRENLSPSSDKNYYTDEETYTMVQTELDYKAPISKEDLANRYSINLAKVSPIYGVDKDSKMWDTDLARDIRKDVDTNPNLSLRLSPYDSTTRYTGTPDERPFIVEQSLEEKYKLSSKSDGINLSSPSDTETKTADLEQMDLIPFWIGRKGVETKTHFRTLLSGFNETVSPEWSSNSFFGNPFKFYTYTGVERNVTFSLLIYCSNPVELAYNWEKINTLSMYTYPEIGETQMVNPPIIDFRIGDIYNKKVGYISSLSYTFPDNGTWETDTEIGLLPKFIEVSISIQFIEQYSDVKNKVYDYTISAEAVKSINEENESNSFNTNPTHNSNGSVVTDKPIKVTKKGAIPLVSSTPKLPKSLGGKVNSPSNEIKGIRNKVQSQSNITDKIGGNSTEAINEAQGSGNLTTKQAEVFVTSLKPQGYEKYTGSMNLPYKVGTAVFSKKLNRKWTRFIGIDELGFQHPIKVKT